ncbi:hypothetical protein DYB32_003044 [Aphanomyces invadans]|uniref:Protein kinase domain-containing protein n=1 Tax=Aphanomyces invadans TaxID=157072 RepID=A0A418B1R1_9STRA|nr:hypothetical protein DYB32_003044 [Aphanomyces invadans]
MLRRAASRLVAHGQRRALKSTLASTVSATRPSSGGVWRALGKGALAVAGATAGAIYYRMQKDEGFSRSAYFYAKVLPAYVDYRMTQIYVEDILKLPDAEQDVYYERLHNRYSDEIFDVILNLKGFYIKIAQLSSTRDDFVPKQYLDRAKQLQSDAPCKTIDEVKAIIENAYGKRMDEVFASFDPTPLGAASIGQVHKAVLLDGTTVVVKVQYPDAEKNFRNDIGTIKSFCALAQPAHLPMMNEIEKQFMNEFDYTREAAHLAEVRANIQASPYNASFVVPMPYPELCTKDVLVMEYLKGKSLLDGINQHFEIIAKERNTTVEALREAQDKEDAERDALGLARRTGPSEEDLRRYQKLLQVRNAWTSAKHKLYDYSIGLVYPRTADAADHKPEGTLLNLAEILRLVVEVHGHEILVNGCFNGDPHPGNIMLLDDGRIGLIDYGQVKKISKEQRHQLARCFVALAEGTKEDVVASALDMGLRTKHNYPDVLEKYMRVAFDRDDKQVTEGLNIQLFIEALEARDPIVSQADDFVMASRVSLLLRGLSYALRYPMSHAQMWSPLAKQVLAAEADT